MPLFLTVFFSTCSDPYVRIDLNTINGDINLDSVLTKTKKKVTKADILSTKFVSKQLHKGNNNNNKIYVFIHCFLDVESRVE